MELIATTVLFATLTALLTLAGLRIWCGRIIASIRVNTAEAEADPFETNAVTLPKALAEKIGQMLPPSPKDADVMRRGLLRAGYWQAGTMKKVYGFKAVLGLALPLAAGFGIAKLQIAQDEKLLAAEALVAAGFFLPNMVVKWRARRRRKRILLSLANALDLMVMCLDAGLALDQTLVETAHGLEHAHPELAQELALVNLEMRAGKDRTETLRDLALRTGMKEMRDVAMILIQSDRIRTSISDALRSHAEQLRAMSGLKLEEKTGRLAVKLAVPLFLCTLPSVLVLMVGPEVVKAWRQVMPMMKLIDLGG